MFFFFSFSLSKLYVLCLSVQEDFKQTPRNIYISIQIKKNAKYYENNYFDFNINIIKLFLFSFFKLLFIFYRNHQCR